MRLPGWVYAPAMAPNPNPRSVNIENIADGDTIVYDLADAEFKPVAPAGLVDATLAAAGNQGDILVIGDGVATAVAPQETIVVPADSVEVGSPTTAEFNAALEVIRDLQAALVAGGLMVAP